MSRHEDYETRFAELARLAYQVGYRLLGDRHEAEDVAQETMTRAYVRWPKVRGHAEAWVVRTTTNLVIGRWRRRRRPPSRATASPGSDHGLADRLALTEALRALPRRQREVAVLRYLGDLSVEHTADALGCTPGTVKQHSARALVALRAAVGAPTEPAAAVHAAGATTAVDRPSSATIHLTTPALTPPRVDAPPSDRSSDVR
jgi:RNA polymerase sigma-70 factor (sigma-E family)